MTCTSESLDCLLVLGILFHFLFIKLIYQQYIIIFQHIAFVYNKHILVLYLCTPHNNSAVNVIIISDTRCDLRVSDSEQR